MCMNVYEYFCFSLVIVLVVVLGIGTNELCDCSSDAFMYKCIIATQRAAHVLVTNLAECMRSCITRAHTVKTHLNNPGILNFNT